MLRRGAVFPKPSVLQRTQFWSKQNNILPLWTLELPRILNSRGLHSKPNKSLTTSDLIRSLKLGSQRDDESATKAEKTDRESSANKAVQFDNRNSSLKTTLSGLIPKHVAVNGAQKKELFSETQNGKSSFSSSDGRNARENADIPTDQTNSLWMLLVDETNGIGGARNTEKKISELETNTLVHKKKMGFDGLHGTDVSLKEQGFPVKSFSRRAMDAKQGTKLHIKIDFPKTSLNGRINNAEHDMQHDIGSLNSQKRIAAGAAITGNEWEFEYQKHLEKRNMDEESNHKDRLNRIRLKSKGKNVLKMKDLSVKPVTGEPQYEYLMRRKGVKAEAEKSLADDIIDYENVGDDWIRKRLGWLCREIPVLKASGIVKMLNNQKKWVKQEYTLELIEHLVKQMEFNRAHRVLKWMQQQRFYKFDYELHNNVAYVLGRNDKVSRCQDVFDEIIKNGRFPEGRAYGALIKAYLRRGDPEDIDSAWKLYNQMLQANLTADYSLYECLLKKITCPTGRWLEQAEELLEKMKASGHYINEEMYTSVIEIHGKRGDHEKVTALIDEMMKEDLEKDINVFNAVLSACAKDGNTNKAEDMMQEIVRLGLKPDWRTYNNLIQVYGKANMPTESWRVFQKMKTENLPMNIVIYQSIINAMSADGLHVTQVLQLLEEVEQSGLKPLQPCYNTVMNMFSRLNQHNEVELIFNRGKSKARPAHTAYNLLIKSYTECGLLEKAEAVFNEIKNTEGIGPNGKTYNLMLKAYGIACFKGKVREIFEEMSERGCPVDPDVKDYIQVMVGAKKVDQLEKQKLKLTDEQREIIPGLLLGGAKMESHDGGCTYDLQLEFNCGTLAGQAIKDHLTYLFQPWLKEECQALSSEVNENELSNYRSPFLTHIETVNHSSLKFYANQYRRNGEPVIPRLIHRWLRPLTLAYWYMYGGRKCQATGGIILNASQYPAKQIKLVVEALKARAMDCKRKKKRAGSVIRFEGRSAQWLWKLMEPHILQPLKDKLRPEELPANLAASQDREGFQSGDEASSDEDEWLDLDTEKHMEASV